MNYQAQADPGFLAGEFFVQTVYFVWLLSLKDAKIPLQ
jgi:hypothetical protein